MPETIIYKTCPKCKQVKSTNDFHKMKSKPDGLNRICKTCNISFVRLYYRTEEGQKAMKEYLQNPEVKKRRRENQVRYRSANQLKIRARSAIDCAIKRKELIRPTQCEKCGVACKPDAHHHLGYEKEHWFDVVWMCDKCHGTTFALI